MDKVRLLELGAHDYVTKPFSPRELLARVRTAMRRSTPLRNASAAATYCSRENRRVTLMGTPAKIDSSMAGSPSGVPGILM